MFIAQSQNSTTTEQPSSPINIDLFGIFKQFNTPEGYLMLGALIGLILLSRFGGGKKGKITSGREAGRLDKLAATQKAFQQIKKRKFKRITLWCGEPRYPLAFLLGKRNSAKLQTFLLNNPPTLWLPDLQRSLLVIGQPGSGKTFSVIDPALESAMQQGFPVLLYDKKGKQLALHAPLAARYGYKVYTFAPGEAYSDSFNFFNFLRGQDDATMAGEIAATITSNAQKPGQKGDAFFSQAGAQLSQALIQLVKAHPNPQYHDLALLYGFLRLPNLVERLEAGIEKGTIPRWVAASFTQFLSTKDAKRTTSSILSTASNTFSAFIQKDLLPSMMGASSIPSYIEGKTLVVFKLDDERRSVVGPILAAALHLFVVKNLAEPRRDPLIVSLDELPSIHLNKLPAWVNEYRSHGGCFICGIQSLQQLHEGYGKDRGEAIAAACSTQILFNPGTNDTAKRYCERYGEKEVQRKTRSTSRSKGSRSVSWSEKLDKVPLFTVDRILGMPQGRCIVTNPAYGTQTRTLLPYALKVNIPASQVERWSECEDQLWTEQVRPTLINRQTHRSLTIDNIDQALDERLQAAQEFLPLPDNEDENDDNRQPSQDKEEVFKKLI